MQEIWKDIKNFEKIYQVSNFGRIRSLDRMIINSNLNKSYFKKGQLLKQHYSLKNQKGYLQVSLWKNGTRKECKVHRLVAEAFIPNFENKQEVNHIDGNKNNNCVNNLEWCNGLENIHHAIKNNLFTNEGKQRQIKAISKTIIQYDLNNNFIKQWPSMKEAERHLGIASSSICHCCKGDYKTAGGYLWRYSTDE